MTFVVAAIVFALSQTGGPGSTGSAVLLGDAYYDGSYGFSVCPPAGWQVIRRREFDGQSTVLLRMFDPTVTGDDRLITVEHMMAARSITIKDRLRQSAAAIAIELPEGKIEVQELRDVSGRPGAAVVVSYRAGDQSRFRQLTMVEIAPRNFLVVRQDCSSVERGATEAKYSAVVGSLKFLSNPLSDERLKSALAEGASWIEKLDGERVLKSLQGEQYFLYKVDDRPMGFVEVYQHPLEIRTGTKKSGRKAPGVEVYEQSWMFDADKNGRRVQSKMTLTKDLLLEKWKSSVVTWVAAKEDRAEQFENAYEEGLRDHDALLSSQTGSFSEPLTQNPPFQVPPTYLSRVLIRLLPRLLGDLSKPRTLAFTAFDHERVGLVVRVLDVKGEAVLPGLSTGRKAYLIEVREGIAAEPAEIFVDEKGNLLLMKSRGLTMEPSTLDELKSLFEERVDKGEAAMVRMEKAYQLDQSRFIRRR